MAAKRRKFNISEVIQRNEVEFGWMVSASKPLI
jgi:hypothetical protein